jgi:hypothetical protein
VADFLLVVVVLLEVLGEGVWVLVVKWWKRFLVSRVFVVALKVVQVGGKLMMW